VKRLLDRIKALLSRRRSNDRRPGSGRPTDATALHADSQASAMEERMEAGPFRSI
jgi:hypothetical protein